MKKLAAKHVLGCCFLGFVAIVSVLAEQDDENPESVFNGRSTAASPGPWFDRILEVKKWVNVKVVNQVGTRVKIKADKILPRRYRKFIVTPTTYDDTQEAYVSREDSRSGILHARHGHIVKSLGKCFMFFITKMSTYKQTQEKNSTTDGYIEFNIQ
ncbi:hypothetical protein OS493_036724 [Desmophyllum pertusum]|uniref:Uncharacterized protein n=1 Tax=Desmophyllum pertusum TaxID=174260 RepID=A0A9W9Z763_9CNID|nr:hypothetical protein OS493_036724 [Desmophyllum pertusum]